MDEARAREVLAQADVVDGTAATAELIALGENAVFGVGDLVVKVGRSIEHGGTELLDRARRELAIASYLAGHDVLAVRAAKDEALVADGHPVTVWHRIPAAVRPAEPRDLAELLKLVHALPTPTGFELPRRSCSAGSSAGCGSRATRSTRPTRTICASVGTGSRRPPRR